MEMDNSTEKEFNESSSSKDLAANIHQESANRMKEIMKNMEKEADEKVQDDVVDNMVSVATPPLLKSLQEVNAPAVDSSNYWFIDTLPTKYRLYPEGTKIEARPLKVIEVKKLSSMNESNADYIINDILRRTIRGIKIDNIYLADKLYIIFWLRNNTFRDSSYVVDFRCPKCDKDSKYHFELNNLKVDYLKEDYDPNKEINLKSGDKLKLRYLKIFDELAFERFKEINGELFDEIDDQLLGLSQMINTVNGKPIEDMLERYKYVLELDPQDFSYISTYIDKYSIGVDPIMNVECQLCGGTSPMGITFRGEFFLPKCTIE